MVGFLQILDEFVGRYVTFSHTRNKAYKAKNITSFCSAPICALNILDWNFFIEIDLIKFLPLGTLCHSKMLIFLALYASFRVWLEVISKHSSSMHYIRTKIKQTKLMFPNTCSQFCKIQIWFALVWMKFFMHSLKFAESNQFLNFFWTISERPSWQKDSSE